MDIRSLHANSICVVGPKTAEALEQFSLKADLIPAEFKAEDICSDLSADPFSVRIQVCG
jgi:uroporphyrinogen III methyltransferase/synthase